MKKIVLIGLFLVAFVFFFQTFSVRARGFGFSFFGGKILAVPAFEIAALEMLGYTCEAGPFDTFSIKPVGSSSVGPYFAGGIPKTKWPAPRVGQWVLGRYVAALPITTFCIHAVTGAVEEVTAHDVTLWGTSKI